MNVRPSLSAFAAAALLIATAGAQGKIKWEKDFKAATERARAENKPIVACFSMKGERVCDVIVEEHYRDPKILELSRHTVNLFCSPHGTPGEREMEKRVRLDLLKKTAADWMVAPQHVFFTPEGDQIFSVPYYITIGELEWTWVAAMRKHDEEFEWRLGDRTRAPGQLAIEKVSTVKELVEPPTKAELEAILKEIKKGFGGYYGAKDNLPIIVRHEGAQAKKFVERILSTVDTTDKEKISVLQVIGANSPKSWWSVVRPMLGYETDTVRVAAAEALAQLGEKQAVKVLLGRWRREEAAAVRGALLRSMVACGAADSRVVKLLPFVLEDHKVEEVRLHAAIAIAGLEDREAVTSGLRTALVDDSKMVRAAAAYSIASRRDEAMMADLRAAAAKEQDAGTKRWMDAAISVVEGGSMAPFEKFTEKLRQ